MVRLAVAFPASEETILKGAPNRAPFSFADMLKPEDFRTPTWRRFAQVLNDRVQELRELNDNQSYGPEQTAAIRGGVAELKKILSLAEEASLSPAVDPDELARSVGDPGQ
jgi:hypothetical protein